MRSRTRLLLGLAAAALAVALLTATALASSAGKAAAGSSASGDTIVFCTDTTYPPMESLQGGKAVGADIDIANALVKLMGKKAEFKTTGFDVIIPSLLKKKCDAIVSALSDTPERRKQVDFADYITVGTLIMVKKGNPAHVTGLASLSGKAVAVQAATTQKALLDKQNALFAKQGKKKMEIKIFPADTNAAAALLTNKVQAYVSDATPVLYYIKKTGDKFEVAGKQLDATPEGIATRKGDPLGPQFKKAIKKLYSSGQMQKILKKWGLSQFALKK